MDIPSKYDPKRVEDQWYSYWMEHQYFHSVPDEREPYTIVIPPPNVTGILHMGHMLNNTLQDVLITQGPVTGVECLLGAWHGSCFHCDRGKGRSQIKGTGNT